MLSKIQKQISHAIIFITTVTDCVYDSENKHYYYYNCAFVFCIINYNKFKMFFLFIEDNVNCYYNLFFTVNISN